MSVIWSPTSETDCPTKNVRNVGRSRSRAGRSRCQRGRRTACSAIGVGRELDEADRRGTGRPLRGIDGAPGVLLRERVELPVGEVEREPGGLPPELDEGRI